jgi:hypothetical protein
MRNKSNILNTVKVEQVFRNIVVNNIEDFNTVLKNTGINSRSLLLTKNKQFGTHLFLEVAENIMKPPPYVRSFAQKTDLPYRVFYCSNCGTWGIKILNNDIIAIISFRLLNKNMELAKAIMFIRKAAMNIFCVQVAKHIPNSANASPINESLFVSKKKAYFAAKKWWQRNKFIGVYKNRVIEYPFTSYEEFCIKKPFGVSQEYTILNSAYTEVKIYRKHHPDWWYKRPFIGEDYGEYDY